MTLQTWLQTGVLNFPSLIKSNSELLRQTPHFHTHSQLWPSLSFFYPFMLQFKNVWICFQDDRAMARWGKWASGSVERERTMGGCVQVYKTLKQSFQHWRGATFFKLEHSTVLNLYSTRQWRYSGIRRQIGGGKFSFLTGFLYLGQV